MICILWVAGRRPPSSPTYLLGNSSPSVWRFLLFWPTMSLPPPPPSASSCYACVYFVHIFVHLQVLPWSMSSWLSSFPSSFVLYIVPVSATCVSFVCLVRVYRSCVSSVYMSVYFMSICRFVSPWLCRDDRISVCLYIGMWVCRSDYFITCLYTILLFLFSTFCSLPATAPPLRSPV